MKSDPLYIRALSTISPLGEGLDEAWAAYQEPRHFLRHQGFDGQKYWVGSLPARLHASVQSIRQEEPDYAELDDTVLMAIYAGRRLAPALAGYPPGRIGINLGSSRGATRLFERYHRQYIEEKEVPVYASPTTTLGNLSSWLAHDLGLQGPAMSHSITCSSGLHAVLNAVAWLRAGMSDAVLAGASESPLTGFTLAQMHALKIYTRIGEEEYPCQSLNLEKSSNTLVLGEAASIALIGRGERGGGGLARIEGLGYATEPLEHAVSLSLEADCFQRSMQGALDDAGIQAERIDAVVMHAPGTRLGDRSEFAAVQGVFRNKMPFVTTHKWKLGHTFATSGLIGMEMACLMLGRQEALPVPFPLPQPTPKNLDRIMVNAVGFGGNAVSLVLSRMDL